jgi:hypothetical protein
MTLRLYVYALVAAVASAPWSAGAQTPTYQGALPAKIVAPRRVAAAPSGDLFVADASGRLYRVTRKGELVGKLLDGVASVAAGPDVLFAAMRDGSVVRLDPHTGRALRRFSLGSSEVASSLAFDAARGKLWIAFESGMLQARDVDGAALHQIPPANGVYRLTGLAVDSTGTVWVAQDRTGAGGTLHAYDAETGKFLRSAPVGVRIVGGVSANAGRVFVSDIFGATVQMVGADGASAGAFGSSAAANGKLGGPSGVANLSNGDVVVANMEGDRLDRFGSGAALPTCAGDADCDGLPDAWEIANGLDPNDPSDALADADRDGLNNSEEYALRTNPRSVDSDGDGYSDAAELAAGFDPNDPNDHRPQLAVGGPGTTGPGLVRLTSTVRDPVGGGACSVAWKQTGGASVALKGATTASPTFVARAAGAYRFQAIGTCGSATSVPASLEVAVNEVAPRADGGRVVTLPAGGALRLGGQFSSDANGGPLAFQWDQVVGPPVSAGVTGGVLSAQLQSPGYYVFRLGAVDGAGNEGAAEVPVVVLGNEAIATAVAASPVRTQVGQAVALDASASYRSAAATFAWAQVDGPAVTLEGAATERATFVAPEAGRYVFEVSVQEAGGRSPPARVEVFAAAAGAQLPVARAAAPATAATDVPVTLDGTASAGAGGLTYTWRQVSGPAAGLTRADRAAATVVLFAAGSYEFELVVADVAGSSVPSRVRIAGRAKSAPLPVAAPSVQPTAIAGDLVLLDGRASTGGSSYRWTQVDGPWVTVEQGAVASFRPVVPGVYGFELEVDDGAVRSAPARVNVVVFQNGTGN